MMAVVLRKGLKYWHWVRFFTAPTQCCSRFIAFSGGDGGDGGCGGVFGTGVGGLGGGAVGGGGGGGGGEGRRKLPI